MTTSQAPNPKTLPGALAGLRVVEMGQLIAGPFCGQLLGDQGADVVKIEAPGRGDPMRDWGQGEHPAWWEVIARNKRSVAIDLRTEEGQALARRLILAADVLIENFRPGTLEKWNLDPAALRRAHPRLIVLRVSGYGQTGPYASRAGFGGIGEAMGGLRALTGYPDRPPVRVGISIGDTLAASYGCIGVLSALHHREKTGQGQIIDSALYEAVLQVMESTVVDHSTSGHARTRHGSILPGIAPSNVYPCQDGEIVIGANGDAIFARLCTAMNRPELAENPRYATHIARGDNQTELDELIAAWTAQHTLEQVETLMTEHAIPAGRIFGPADMATDPHFAAREAIIERPHPDHGTIRMQSVFPKLSDTPGSIRRNAPREIGAHTDEVLCEWLGDKLGD